MKTIRPATPCFLFAARSLLKGVQGAVFFAAGCLGAPSAFGAVDLMDSDPRTHVVSTETPAQGSAFTVAFVVRNAGNTVAEDGEVTFYLSTDTVPGNAGDIALGTKKLPLIPAAGTAAFSTSLTMNASGGPWRLIWVLSHPNESDTRNNEVAFSRTLTVPAPPPVFDLEDTGAANRSLSTNTPSPGESFEVTAKVRNLGPGAAPGYSVEFRLSTDAVIGDADDVVLGARTMAGLGAPGGGFVLQQEVGRTLTIPENQAPGTYRFGYRIIAPADTVQSNNNVLFGASITVPAPPVGSVDLVDAGASHWGIAPAPVFFQGNPVRVSGAIRNLGSLASTGFSLTFFASSDDTAGDADDVILTSVAQSALAPFLPSFAMRSFDVLVPTTLLQAGVTYRFGWIITGGSDGNTANNRTMMTTALLSLPPPPIELAGLWNVSGDRVAHDEATFLFSGQVRNNSSVAKSVALKAEFRREGENDPVWDEFMEFPGATPGEENWELVIPANTQIDVTGELQRVEIQKPWNPFITQRFLPAGTYQVTIRAYEHTDVPRYPLNPVLQDSLLISQSIPVSAPSRPDLELGFVFRSVSWLNPEAVQPGGAFTISDIEVRNRGVEDSPPSIVRFYANETPIGSNVPVPAIERSRSDPFVLPDTTVTIPSSMGTGLVDIYAVVDPEDDLDEDAELNNRVLVGTIVVGFQPDLTDAGASNHVIPEAVLPGVMSQLKVRVRNQGLGQSGSFTTSFYLFDSRGVTDQDIPGAISLGSVTTSGLAFLQTLDLPLTFTIPTGTASGTWYVGWKFDSGNAATETVETNNFHVSNQPLHVGPAVNLRPGSTPFALSATEVVAGGTFTLTGSRANTGSAAAGTHRSWVVLSTDNVVNSGDLVLVNSLNSETATPAGSDFTLTHTITLSAGIAPGVYHVGYLFDATNQVNELREGDNIVTLTDLLQIVAPAPPGAPPPAPEVVAFEVGKRDAFISWTSRKGLNYEIETSPNAQRWDVFGEATGEPGVTGFTLPDLVTGHPRQFVRVRLVP